MRAYFGHPESSIDSPLHPVAALDEWSTGTIAAVAMGKEIAPPPEIPRFETRREIREYLKNLTGLNRFLSGAYEADVASDGLVDALRKVREQQTQLSPPPKTKRVPYTPRHQR